MGYRQSLRARFSVDIQYLQQGKTETAVQAMLPPSKTSAQVAKDTAEAMLKRGQGLSALYCLHP